MAIPWKQVEQSGQYQSLSIRDKFLAKKEYWDNVVKNREDFIFLDSDKQNQAKTDFFGGTLSEDIPDFENKENRLRSIGSVIKFLGQATGVDPLGVAGQITKERVPRETFLGTQDVVRSSGLKTASGIVTPFLKPKETLRGIKGMLMGTFQKIIPGEQPEEVYFDNLAKVYKDRYGSTDAIAETVANDPFGFISDVYMAAGVTSLGLKTAGKLTGIKELSKAGAMPITENAISSTTKKIKDIKIIKDSKDKIFTAYNKSIGAKGKTIKKLERLKDDVVDEVNIIQKNLPEEGLQNTLTGETFIEPSNRWEYLQGLQNAKEKVWQKATSLSEGATEAGAKIDIGKIAKRAANKTKVDIGDIRDINLRKVVDKIDDFADDLAIQYPEGVTPSQAQQYLRTMTKEVQRRRQQATPIDFDLDDFKTNLYQDLVDSTDEIIEATLDNSGYKHYRKEYSILRGGEESAINAANNFLKRQARGRGVTHPIANLFSLEAIGNGVATGQTSKGLLKALTIQGAKNTLDFLISPDRPIKSMFRNAKFIKTGDPINVFNPSVVRDVPISGVRLLTSPEGIKKLPKPRSEFVSQKQIPKIIPKKLEFKGPTKIKSIKRLPNEASGEVIIMQDPVRRLTYKPGGEGVRFGPEITGGSQGLTGGFGQFITKEGKIIRQRRIPRSIKR